MPRDSQIWMSHSDTVQFLPEGTRVIACNQDNVPVALQWNERFFGIQFHPEVTYAMICRWLTRAWDRMDVRGARPPHEHREGWYQHDPAIDRWIQAFLAAWLASQPVRP